MDDRRSHRHRHRHRPGAGIGSTALVLPLLLLPLLPPLLLALAPHRSVSAFAFRQPAVPFSASPAAAGRQGSLPRGTALRLASEPNSSGDSSSGDGKHGPPLFRFRRATPADVAPCFEIESASYPPDEAASLRALADRQSLAGDYFLVCTEETTGAVAGFVCATRCHAFTEASMSEPHDPAGRLLAVHSVVVREDHRRKGLATEMLGRYFEGIASSEDGADASEQPPIESVVCIAKEHLLGFYVRCGFRVNRPSPIVHGRELWYDLERELRTPNKEESSSSSAAAAAPRTRPGPGESWFCKTERFKPSLSFPEIKPHLEAHSEWVRSLRSSGEACIVSGYRVDADGRPGGGGLMFLAAASHEEALELVRKDPLVANGCVDWELNGWIGQVGGIRAE